jgi:S-adenosylmethionine:diacylglycerol 3-amino-3-carboxypropyl transferase
LFNVLKQKPDSSLTHFNFLDVPDWLSRDTQEMLLREILRTSKKNAIFLQRTVKRDSFIEQSTLNEHFELLKDTSNRASSEDRSCCYKRVNYYKIHKVV